MLRHWAWAYVTVVLGRMKNTYLVRLHQLGSEALGSRALLLPRWWVCRKNAGVAGAESPSLPLLQGRDRNKHVSGGVHRYLVGALRTHAPRKKLRRGGVREEPLWSAENFRREQFYCTLKSCSTLGPFLDPSSHLSLHPASHSLI